MDLNHQQKDMSLLCFRYNIPPYILVDMEGAAPSPPPRHIPFARSLARQRFLRPSSQGIVLLLNYTIRINFYKSSWQGFAPCMMDYRNTIVSFAHPTRLPVPPQKDNMVGSAFNRYIAYLFLHHTVAYDTNVIDSLSPLAGREGFEPSSDGFGDRCATVTPPTYM